MPVTGLYFCPDSGTTQAPAATIVDRLTKRYQPVFLGKWTLEHRLLRENASTSGPSSSSTQTSNPPLPTTTSTSGSQRNTVSSANTANNPPLSAGGSGVPTNTTSQPRFMQFLELSHHPGKRFCLVDSHIVTIDPEFEHILTSKLQGLWGMRQTLKAEGHIYELEDFRIRIATLSQGSVMKGVLMEVEYLPCEFMEEAEDVIRDLIEQLELPRGAAVRLYLAQNGGVGVGGKGLDVEMNGGVKEAKRKFTVLDTGLQYMELLRLR